MNIKKLGIILAAILFSAKLGTSQTLLHLKAAPVAYHPFTSPNKPHLYENKIDANGNWVVEPCVMLSIETYLRGTKLSWRFMPGFYSDVLSQPAMFFHLGIKYNFLQIWRSSFDIAVGPTLNIRQDWHKVPGYIPESSYKLNGNWENQINFIAELEYKYFLTDRIDLTSSILYGHEWKTITATFGFRYWLSTTIKHPINCGSCPFSDPKYKSKRR